MKLIYRVSMTDPGRTLPSYVKGSGLTNAEIDGNFKIIDVEMATKAPLDSPAFVNNPTAPTAAPGTNTTQIATTEFATNAIKNGALTLNVSGSGLTATPTTFSANQATDATYTITINSSSTATPSTLVFRDASGNTEVNVLTLQDSLKIGATTIIDSSRTIQNLGAPLSVSQGGTGATTAANARTSLGSTTIGDALFIASSADSARTTLGLGTVSTESVVPVAKGGTGVTSLVDLVNAINTGTVNLINDANTSIIAGNSYAVYVTALRQLTLPASPNNGDTIVLQNHLMSWASKANIVRGSASHYINGLQEDMLIDTELPMLTLKYYNLHWTTA